MNRTGMQGYIPENILVYVAVDADRRGEGIGKAIVERALEEADGDVKLHVEYDNPAKRLYERLGFASKYAEMRWTR
jgi:GNAT superfamily N-acetyltransferase